MVLCGEWPYNSKLDTLMNADGRIAMINVRDFGARGDGKADDYGPIPDDR